MFHKMGVSISGILSSLICRSFNYTTRPLDLSQREGRAGGRGKGGGGGGVRSLQESAPHSIDDDSDRPRRRTTNFCAECLDDAQRGPRRVCGQAGRCPSKAGLVLCESKAPCGSISNLFVRQLAALATAYPQSLRCMPGISTASGRFFHAI